MINSIGPSYVPSSRSNHGEKHLKPEIKNILKQLDLKVQLSHISLNPSQMLASPQVIEEIKKKLKEVEKETYKPDKQLLDLLGIETPLDELELVITEGGKKFLKMKFSDLTSNE